MRSCPACGGSAPPEAGWCGQCFAPLDTQPEAESQLSRPLVGAAAPVGVNRFGLPEAPAVDRFGLPVPAGQPPAPVTTVIRPESTGPMLGGTAIALVITAICIGAVGMGVSMVLGHDQNLEPATYIRYALVLTIGVYVVVGGLIAVRLVPGVRLRWHTGNPASSILIGAACGGTVSALLLAAVSGASGHLAPDPRIVTLMSEGDIAHIVATVGISCLAAPLIEEVLFRGLLLESLRGSHGGRVALWVSGVAFAVWHLNPAALRYYALMGAFLGFLYMRRGLVCSIAAHLAFNGVLTVAALAVVLAPAKTLTYGNISISAPGGWHQHDAAFDPGGLELVGPSDSELIVAELAAPSTPTPQTIISRIQSGLLTANQSGVDVQVNTAREVDLPAGSAVEVDLNAKGHAGTLVYVSRPGQIVEVVFMSGGSMKARSDFPHMLDSLRVG